MNEIPVYGTNYLISEDPDDKSPTIVVGGITFTRFEYLRMYLPIPTEERTERDIYCTSREVFLALIEQWNSKNDPLQQNDYMYWSVT